MDKPITILVVEGTRPAAGDLRSLMSGLPIRLLQAETVPEALRTARAEKPDVILLDADRPGGEDLPKAAAFGRIPMIAFSEGNADRARLLAAGCLALLRRPFGLRELARPLAWCLAPPPARCPA